MTEPDGSRSAPRSSSGRGVRIALGLSLAVNLLIIGLVAGVFLGRAGDMRDGPGRATALRSLGLAPVVVALEPEDRAALQARLEADRGRVRADAVALAQSFRRFTETLATEPFDRAAVAAALEAQRGHVLTLQQAGHGLLLDQLEAMTPQARVALAERMQRRQARREGGTRP